MSDASKCVVEAVWSLFKSSTTALRLLLLRGLEEDAR